MKSMMILAALIAAGVLATTGCSTCCKKDGTCTKSTAAVACTNNLIACGGVCTNKLSADFIACGGVCTNKLSADLIACGGVCTNKLSGAKS